jgi:hypothetical protein
VSLEDHQDKAMEALAKLHAQEVRSGNPSGVDNLIAQAAGKAAPSDVDNRAELEIKASDVKKIVVPGLDDEVLDADRFEEHQRRSVWARPENDSKAKDKK